MKNIFLTFILIGSTASFSAAETAAVTTNDSRAGGMSFAGDSTASSEQANQKEDEAYNAAQDAMRQGNYSQASEMFDSVAKMNGRKADAATYWKAYTLNKQARRNEALSAIADLRKNFPRSNYVRDAGALEIEIRQASGESVNPAAEADDEMKLIALQALMDQNEDRALPILKKILTGNSSQKVKDKAIFVLSQNDSPSAQQLLGDMAIGKEYPGLQEKAIHYLGISGHGGAQLQRVYDGSSDEKIKKAVLHAFMVSGDQDRVFALATKETSPELKKEAIHQLGVMGAHDKLRQLYKTATTPEEKKELIHSLGVGGDTDGLIEMSKSEANPEVKAELIHSLGVFGGKRAGDALAEMYNAAGADRNTKSAVINALFVNGSAKQLVSMARKETDPEMKKQIVSKLSIMGSKEGNDYLLEILNQ